MRTHQDCLIAAAAVLLCHTSAPAQVILTTQHVDVGLGFESGQWNLHIHDEDNNREFRTTGAPGATDWAVLLVNEPASRTSRPAGAQWDFLGTAAGSDVYVLPQTQSSQLLFLGISTEEINPPTAFTSPVTLTLKVLTGPAGANFSVWSTDQFGTPTARMSTTNGISAADNLSLPIGAHGHFNYGFTQPGRYQIAFEASATPSGTNPPRSGDVIYTFDVAPIPEPSSVALVGLAAAGWAVRRLRRAGMTPKDRTPPSQAGAGGNT